MPRIHLEGVPDDRFEPAPRLDLATVHAAVDRWRARVGDLSRYTLEVHPNRGDAYVAADDPFTIHLFNAEAFWRGDVDVYARALDFLRERDTLSQTEYEGLRTGIPQSYADRLTETLYHEYAHSLTFERFGDYNDGEWQWCDVMPGDLLEPVEAALSLAGRDVTRYNVGEVIAEDTRRWLTGRHARPNRLLFRVDVNCLETAWHRAGRMWRWLANP